MGAGVESGRDRLAGVLRTVFPACPDGRGRLPGNRPREPDRARGGTPSVRMVRPDGRTLGRNAPGTAGPAGAGCALCVSAANHRGSVRGILFLRKFPVYLTVHGRCSGAGAAAGDRRRPGCNGGARLVPDPLPVGASPVRRFDRPRGADGRVGGDAGNSGMAGLAGIRPQGRRLKWLPQMAGSDYNRKSAIRRLGEESGHSADTSNP